MDGCTAGPWSSAGPGSETVVIGYVAQKGMFRTDTCYNVLNASPEILGIIDGLVKISVVRRLLWTCIRITHKRPDDPHAHGKSEARGILRGSQRRESCLMTFFRIQREKQEESASKFQEAVEVDKIRAKHAKKKRGFEAGAGVEFDKESVDGFLGSNW
ncbi:hypothetical protein YC2023_113558 [Brassica napus]